MLQRLQTIPPALAASSRIPLLLLLLSVSTVFIFGQGHSYLMRYHDWTSSSTMAQVANLDPQHNFLLFHRQTLDDAGNATYEVYSRYPIGGYALLKLADLPVGDNFAAQIYAARLVMLAFFTAAAVLAWLSLARITGNPWLASAAVLLAFSAFPLLYYNHIIGEAMFHLFGILLAFHGMVVFVQEGRFRQLLIKTALALLLGWHVYALLAAFILLGLGRELLTRPAASESPYAPAGPWPWLKQRPGIFLRSRHLHLGIFALFFGLALLTINVGNEYLTFEGRYSLAQLPTVESALFRLGADAERNAVYAYLLAWPNYLEEQLYRFNLMSIPYALTGWFDVRGEQTSDLLHWHHIAKLPSDELLWNHIALSGAIIVVCLVGLLLGRHKLLLATLALSGVLWAAAMRNQVAFHHFESLYYIGTTRVFFTAILLALDRLTRRFLGNALAIVTALAAAPLFILSAYQVSAVGYDPEVAQWHQEVLSDFENIREHTPGKTVFVPLTAAPESRIRFAGTWLGLDYYLAGSPILFAHQEKFRSRADFVIAGQPEPGPALLTPQNKRIFLYDRAVYRGQYGSIVSGPPTATATYELYLRGNVLTYLKEPCGPSEADGRFSLHLYPLFPQDVTPERRQHGFNNLDFHFDDFGVRFDGKCLLTVPLPDYPLTEIETGQDDAWHARFPVDNTDLYRAAYLSATAAAPVHRAPFDLYIQDDRLYFIKESCAPSDTADRFFLHFVPVNNADLPPERRQHGTDNFDFDFARRGALFDGKCLAVAALPAYPVKEIRTGQFVIGGNRFWETSFPPPLQDTR